MGTRLRVTALEVRDHPDAVVRGFPIAEVVILARTEPIEVEGPDDLHIEWSGDLGLSPDLGPNLCSRSNGASRKIGMSVS
jgi:hypothetical protein